MSGNATPASSRVPAPASIRTDDDRACARIREAINYLEAAQSAVRNGDKPEALRCLSMASAETASARMPLVSPVE